MKILVVNNAVPFSHGGAEELALNFVRELNAVRGVQAELMRVPFNWVPNARLLDEILLNQSFQIDNVDRVIGLKFPAYLIPHPHKTLWLLHQFRQVYDLKDGGQSPYGDDDESRTIVEAVRRADAAAFSESQRIFVNSPVTQKRLQRYNGFASEVLYPPLNDPHLFGRGEHGNYLFAGGRIEAGKRQHLLIEAAARTKAPVKLVIAGPASDADYIDGLRELIRIRGVEDKVSLLPGLRPRAEIAEFINSALGVVYIPYDEDSLGYVTMEAFAGGKAVLTTTDSGGLLEIVGDDRTGYVRAPDAEGLADGMDKLWLNRNRTIELGRTAQRTLEQRGLTWKATIERLLAA